ncbi:MAG: hypothetical protein MJ252_00885 [archaeon]|nr:hypothetical protein [archaeon]
MKKSESNENNIPDLEKEALPFSDEDSLRWLAGQFNNFLGLFKRILQKVPKRCSKCSGNGFSFDLRFSGKKCYPEFKCTKNRCGGHSGIKMNLLNESKMNNFFMLLFSYYQNNTPIKTIKKIFTKKHFELDSNLSIEKALDLSFKIFRACITKYAIESLKEDFKKAHRITFSCFPMQLSNIYKYDICCLYDEDSKIIQFVLRNEKDDLDISGFFNCPEKVEINKAEDWRTENFKSAIQHAMKIINTVYEDTFKSISKENKIEKGDEFVFYFYEGLFRVFLNKFKLKLDRLIFLCCFFENAMFDIDIFDDIKDLENPSNLYIYYFSILA